MKAVLMAGGEGTRLRPMTASMPKPLLPVVNRPIMEHVLRLLKRHGLTDTVVTVQFLADLVTARFGDGEELGMRLTYAHEETPLGTAGSVKNAEAELAGEPFLVISGDALTDFDLSDLLRFHRDKGAMVTVCLTRKPNPLEFGITIVKEDGRVDRFLEKPTWGQVFSDTVNTGIYVMQPEVLDYVAEGESVDWSSDVFPQLMKEGKPVYGYVAEGYWEDVGTHESYVKAQADVLEGRVDVEIDGEQREPGVWLGEGAEVHPDAVLRGPLCVGAHARVEAGAELRELTVLGEGAVVKRGAFLHRAVVQDNAYIGPGTNLRGCVVGRSTDVMRGARVEDGAVIGDDCLIGEQAVVAGTAKIFPRKTIAPGALVDGSVQGESRGDDLFTPRGVTGIVNGEITPEVAVRIAGAYATTLKKGATVTIARDHSLGARALKRAMVSALQGAAIEVRDLENVPLPVARQQTARGSAGGIMLRTTAGLPDSLDVLFLDARGADLSPAGLRRLKQVFTRQQYRRAFPGETGSLRHPASPADPYAGSLLDRIDVTGVAGAGLRVVVDAAHGSAGLVLPNVLGRLPLDAVVLNLGLDTALPAETPADRSAALELLGRQVPAQQAAFGLRFDPVGERLSFVDETGRLLPDDRAALVLLELVAAERGGGTVVLPVTASREAEQLAAAHGVKVHRTGIGAGDLARGVAEVDDPILGADGRGAFVLPEFADVVDGTAAFVRLAGLLARTGGLTLGQCADRLPPGAVAHRVLATPGAVRDAVANAVATAAAERGAAVDRTHGVRVELPDGQWVLVAATDGEPAVHLWAEAADLAAAEALLEEWSAVAEWWRS